MGRRVHHLRQARPPGHSRSDRAHRDHRARSATRHPAEQTHRPQGDQPAAQEAQGRAPAARALLVPRALEQPHCGRRPKPAPRLLRCPWLAAPARSERATTMRVQGTVEDGTGTNSRTVDPATLTALGYTPHRGTLNIRVNPALRLAVMELPGLDIDGVTYWPATIEGHGQGHVRTSRDRRTLEIVHQHRLRDTLTNGNQVTITVRPQPRWRLSASIMAHPVRQAAAEELQASLDRPTPIIYDTNPVPSDDRAQRWATGRAAWEAHDPTADAHIVLQDDALVSEDFLAGLEV